MANPPELPAAPKKKSKFKLIMILIALLLLLGGGAGGFWWFTMRDPGSPMPSLSDLAGKSASAETSPAAPQAKDVAPPVSSTKLVSLPTVTVNLADTASARYLKVGMDVEVSTPEAVAEIQAQTARIRDAIIILLSSKTYAALASAEGKIQLKNEVASRLNQILGTPRVVRIYFTDFVVQ